MGVNHVTHGASCPRLKTLWVALSFALAGGGGLLGMETASAAQRTTHFIERTPTNIPKATKQHFRHVAGSNHSNAKRVDANLQSFLSRTPRFTEAPGAQVIRVTQLSDSGEGSLREALSQAHDGDVVDLSAMSGHIALTHALTPASSVIIRGPGSDKLFLDGGGLDRIINSSHDLKISGVTLANGSVRGTKATGGCLNVTGYVYLANATISNCKTGDADSQYSYGGAVYVNGELYMYNAQLTQNSVTAYQIAAGGGAFVRTSGGSYSVGMAGSTISGNSVTLDSSVNRPASSLTFGFGGGVVSIYIGTTAGQATS